MTGQNQSNSDEASSTLDKQEGECSTRHGDHKRRATAVQWEMAAASADHAVLIQDWRALDAIAQGTGPEPSSAEADIRAFFDKISHLQPSAMSIGHRRNNTNERTQQ